MTLPTYRIRSEYRPDSTTDTLPWIATAVHLHRELEAISAFGATREEALEGLRAKIAVVAAEPATEEFEADENGWPLEQTSGHMMGAE